MGALYHSWPLAQIALNFAWKFSDIRNLHPQWYHYMKKTFSYSHTIQQLGGEGSRYRKIFKPFFLTIWSNGQLWGKAPNDTPNFCSNETPYKTYPTFPLHPFTFLNNYSANCPQRVSSEDMFLYLLGLFPQMILLTTIFRQYSGFHLPFRRGWHIKKWMSIINHSPTEMHLLTPLLHWEQKLCEVNLSKKN